MKYAVLVLWAACLAAFFLPATSPFAVPGQRLFWGLMIVHAIECVVFLPKRGAQVCVCDVDAARADAALATLAGARS